MPRKQNDSLARKLKSAASLIQQLRIQSENLTRADIEGWRRAHQQALNVDNPQRTGLYRIYDYTIDIDNMVAGIVMRTKFGVMSRPFRIVDAAGETMEEAARVFAGEWFRQYMNLALDAYYYGHCLIETGDIVSMDGVMGFSGMKLIPRRHVCPEYGVLLKDAGDDPSRGIPFREGPYRRSLIEAGDAYGLGAYLKIAPSVIGKKNAQIFWDNFAERFGIPILYAKVDSRDKDERAKAANMLRNLGSNAWALFGTGVTIDKVETSTGDAFEVFDRRIARADEQISIALAGQTMSFTDGSSLSQAQVHERGFKEVKDKLAEDLAANINNRLIPHMLLNGFPVQGCRFVWDDAYRYSPEEMLRVESLLLQHYRIRKDYFVNKYHIEIEGDKNPLGMADDGREEMDFFA